MASAARAAWQQCGKSNFADCRFCVYHLSPNLRRQSYCPRPLLDKLKWTFQENSGLHASRSIALKSDLDESEPAMLQRCNSRVKNCPVRRKDQANSAQVLSETYIHQSDRPQQRNDNLFTFLVWSYTPPN